MPNIKSAKKRVLIAQKKTLQNKSINSNLKTVIKKANATLEEGSVENAQAAVRVAVKKIDQAAARGIMHKNAAAHNKSALALKLNALAK